MITLVIDSETTGIPARREVITSPSYPHVVELAGLLIDDRERELSSFHFIVRPDGWEIPVDAAQVHGIDQAMALRLGVPLRIAVASYTNLLRIADRVAGHNLEYDLGIVSAAIYRCGVNPSVHPVPNPICTADLGAPVVNLPPTERMIAAGFNKPKRPKLEELYRFLFEEMFDGAHGALADCRAAWRCLAELERRATA